MCHDFLLVFWLDKAGVAGVCAGYVPKKLPSNTYNNYHGIYTFSVNKMNIMMKVIERILMIPVG